MRELDDATLLTRLIDTAERVLNRGSIFDDGFDDLADEIVRRRAVPAQPRFIDDAAAMLVTALRNVVARRYAADLAQWKLVAAALLEPVRSAFGRALDERRNVRPDPEAQPNYRGGR